jgi:hypothetical protein
VLFALWLVFANYGGIGHALGNSHLSRSAATCPFIAKTDAGLYLHCMACLGIGADDFYGFPWISMDFYGFLWISMDFYGFIWIFMDSYGFLWIPMDSYEFKWFPMDSNSYGFL